MDKAYINEYTTRQQRLRDKKITELLEHYVKESKNLVFFYKVFGQIWKEKN